MNNEIWQFDEFHNSIEILVGGALSYREHFRLRPQIHDMTSQVVCGTYSGFETLHVFGPDHAARSQAIPLTGDCIWESTRECGSVRRSVRQ